MSRLYRLASHVRRQRAERLRRARSDRRVARASRELRAWLASQRLRVEASDPEVKALVEAALRDYIERPGACLIVPAGVTIDIAHMDRAPWTANDYIAEVPRDA